jgi:hypothetical protein
MRITRKQSLLMAIVPVQIFLSILAWRDISRRSDDQVRGPKRFWRVFVTLNPGNSLAYWMFARR